MTDSTHFSRGWRVFLILSVAWTTGVVYAAGPRLAGPRNLPTRWLLEEDKKFLQVQTDAGNLAENVPQEQVQSWVSEALNWWVAGQYVRLPGTPDTVFSATGQVLTTEGLVQAATGIAFAGPVALATDIASVTEYQMVSEANLDPGNIVQIVSDADGSVIDLLYGENARNSILGLSENVVSVEGRDISGQILLSTILLNGDFLNRNPSQQTLYPGVILHELGHSLGLDHAQLYSHLGGVPYGENLPVMYPLEFPVSWAGFVSPTGGPRFDDTASLSLLYPSEDYYTNLGRVYGQVILDATTPVLGANVVARRKSGPTENQLVSELQFVTSCVSDFLATDDGAFYFGALPSGTYELWVEPVLTEFVGSTGVGPYSENTGDESFRVRTLPEYWSLPEDASPEIDNRSNWTGVSVAAGEDVFLASPFIVSTMVQDSTEENTQILADHLTHFGGMEPAPSFTDRFQYTFHVSPADLVVIISITPEVSAAPDPEMDVQDLDLYVRKNDRVSPQEFDFQSAQPEISTEQIVLASDVEPIDPGVYFIGVNNAQGGATRFNVTVDRAVATPTPTFPPTPTPTPPLLVDRAFLAGLNQDPDSDNLGRYGTSGSVEARMEGNLIGSPIASMFITPGGASPEGYFVPAYDENISGGLLDANIEPGDTLLIAAELSHVATGIVTRIVSATPEEDTYLEALAELSQWVAADFRAENATAGVLSLDASGQLSTKTGISAIPPTSATGVVLSSSPLILATDSLRVMWDGRFTRQQLRIADKTLTTRDLISAATLVVNATGQNLDRLASPIGVDLDGPKILSSTDTPPISVPVMQRPWPGAPDRHLFIYRTGGEITNELIAGDIVLVTGLLDVREYLDGEDQLDGDILGMNDVDVDFSAFGGQASPLSSTTHPQLGEEFIKLVTGGVIVSVTPPVAGAVQYLATGSVASVTNFVSSGDYSLVELVLSATDDVTPSTSTSVFLRVDTSPLVIASVESQPNPDRRSPNNPWIALFQNDELTVTSAIMLEGDPPDAPIVTADLSDIQPGLTHASPEIIESTTQWLAIRFTARVTEESTPNNAASFVITATDDAGNVTVFDSEEVDMLVSVDPRPYVEPTPTFYEQYTPTPTPTATPTPHLSLPMDDIIVAASNADAIVDNQGFKQGLVSSAEGNLVNSATAALFTIPITVPPGIKGLQPLFDPTISGTLLDRNIEVGDTLFVAATISGITPELVDAVANAVPGTAEYETAQSAVLPLVFARVSVPAERMLIENATGEIFPTDAREVIGDEGREPDTLLYVWDGFRTEPALQIASATTFDPQSVLDIHLAEDPERYIIPASAIGVDTVGPRLHPVSDSPIPALIGVERNNVTYMLTEGLLDTFELRNGDEVTLLAAIDVRGDWDGESADFGDSLTASGVNVDFSEIGGPTSPMPEDFAFQSANDSTDSEETAGLSAALSARAIVGSSTPVTTSGAYGMANIVVSITTDVVGPYIENLPIRIDTAGPDILGGNVSSQTALRVDDRHYVLTPGDVVYVTGTVDLNGDDIDATTPTLEAPNLGTTQRLLSPTYWAEHPTEEDTAEASFRIRVGQSAITVSAAPLILRATDNAGNMDEANLALFDIALDVQNGPTPTPTNTIPPTPTWAPTLTFTPTPTPTLFHQFTPTPTPTATNTPTPPLRLAAANIILAASNLDAVDDNLGRFGAPGTVEARSVGNLTGTSAASLFTFPSGDAENGFLAPIYDPNVEGSLIDQNIEPGDVLLAAGTATNIDPEIVSAIRGNPPGSAEYREALESLSPNIYLRFVGDAALLDNAELLPSTRVSPTSATGLPPGSDRELTSLLFHWNGFETTPSLTIGPAAVSSTTAVTMARLEIAFAGGIIGANLNPVGFDADGPDFESPSEFEIVSAVRNDPISGQEIPLTVEPDTEFLSGDRLMIAARLESNADLDGQREVNADQLRLSDVNLDASDIGDNAVIADKTFAESTENGFVRIDEPLTAEAIYLATVSVEKLSPVTTEGDYYEAQLEYSAWDDVRPAGTASLTVRVDTAEPRVTDLIFTDLSGNLPSPALQIAAGDYVAVTATVNLSGDPADSISTDNVRANLTALDPTLESVPARRLKTVDTTTPIVEGYWTVQAQSLAFTNPRGSIVVHVTDDAGNTDELDSAEIDRFISIDNGPTPTPTQTPTATATPTSTPTPRPYIAASGAIVAASNVDAASDTFADIATTREQEGDLVNSPLAALFVDTGSRLPLYDPSVRGSLTTANIEPGDALILAATLSQVDPSLMNAIRDPQGDPDVYRAAIAAVTSMAYARFDLTDSEIAIENLSRRNRVYPTGAFPADDTSRDVILQWNGFVTEPKLVISEQSEPMTTTQNIVQVYASSDPANPIPGTPIGVDMAGPEFVPREGDETPGYLLSVRRELWPDQPPVYLRLYDDPAGQGYLNEFIDGDIISMAGDLIVHEDLDGEEQENGDPLDGSMMTLEAEELQGGAHQTGQPDGDNSDPEQGWTTPRGFFEIDRGWVRPIPEPVTGETQFHATAVVASVSEVSTEGDYTEFEMTLVAADDVGRGDETQIRVRVDTIPPSLADLQFETTSDKTFRAGETVRPLLSVGDELTLRAIVRLEGDPPDAPWLILHANSVRPEAPDVQNTVPPVPVDEESVEVGVSTSVSAAAVTTNSATVGLTVLDDAGNSITVDSADYGIIFAIQAEPTPVEPSNGDLNDDGEVNRLDLYLFARAWLDDAAVPGTGADLVVDPGRQIDDADLLRLLRLLKNQAQFRPTPTPTPVPVPPTPTPTPVQVPATPTPTPVVTPTPTVTPTATVTPSPTPSAG